MKYAVTIFNEVNKVMNDLKISYMIGNISSLKTLLSSVSSVLEENTWFKCIIPFFKYRTIRFTFILVMINQVMQYGD